MRVFRPFGVVAVFVAVLLLISGCAAPLPNHPEQLHYPALEFNLPEAETLVLDNGIRLFLKEDRELPTGIYFFR